MRIMVMLIVSTVAMLIVFAIDIIQKRRASQS